MKSVLNKILIITIAVSFLAYSTGIVVIKHFCLTCKIENASFFVHDTCKDTNHSNSYKTKHSEEHSCCKKAPLKSDAKIKSLCCVYDITFLKIFETFKISESFSNFNQDHFINNNQEFILQSLKLFKHCFKIKLPPDKIPLSNLNILFSNFIL